MNKFILLPNTPTLAALLCCSISVLLTPHASIPTKFIFLASAIIFAHLRAPLHFFGYVFSLIVSNIVFAWDTELTINDGWMHTWLTLNICSIGLFVVNKEISEWNILNYLSHKEVWRSVPEISFVDAENYVPEKHESTLYHTEFKRDLKLLSMSSEDRFHTDFKVDMQGAVQGLMQTCIKPLTYRGETLGYCKILTHVHLPQEALYDLFTCIDGSESTYNELFGNTIDHARLLLDPQGNIVSWNPGVLRVKGYTRAEIIGKHFSMFYTIEDRIAGRPLADLAVARSEGHTEIEGWMQRKDGELFWACINLTSVRSNSGQLIGFSVITRDYTEKKKKLDTLKATEEKYHLLVSSVTDYTIIMLDRDGIITTWNAGAQKINGYHAEEVIGRHFSIFYDAAALAAKQPERELELAASEGRFEEEGWRVKKDGTRFYANVVLSAIYNSRKEIVGFSKVTRDITEKMKAQAALRDSEERFQLLISSVKDYSIIMIDTRGLITTWNCGVKNTSGFDAEDTIGNHFSLFYTPAQQVEGLPQQELDIALKEGRFEGEGWRARKDGSQIWANFTISAVYDGATLVGYSCITRDVTEKKYAQEQIRIMDERIQLLISSVKDYAIFMLDPDGFIISWNSGAQRIKGYTAEEAIGQHFSAVYTKEDRANKKDVLALKIAATDGRFEDEGLRVRKDGSTFWANVIISAMRDNTGRLVGFSKVTRDITERRQTDIALRAAMQSAQAAALAKQSFLAMMSHEIRTPLHAVITLSQLLQTSDLDETQRDYLETIHNSSKQLLSIINDILDFSKIESGKMELITKPFNLRQSIEETIDLVLVKPCTTKLNNNLIDVVYIMSPDVPENIISDTVRVRQVLMNYMSNAVKFTSQGEVVVRVSCEPKDYKENDPVTITFAVHDTGIGIKSPNLDDLFQPFFQIVPGASQVFGGTGLGLVISKKLSQLMGGNVWVESKEGVGSTFFFSISAQVGKLETPQLLTPISKCNFMVLDESEAGAEALSQILRYAGCIVFCVSDFGAATELARTQSFEGVFITRQLLAKDDGASTQQLKAKCPGVPFFLTGTPDSLEYHSSAIPRNTQHAELFRAFLSKPFRTDSVRSVLRMTKGKMLTILQPSSPTCSPLASPIVSPIADLRILVAEDNAVNRKVAIRILDRLGYVNVDMVENGEQVLKAMETKTYDVILMDIQMPVMDGWTATQRIFELYPPDRRPAIIAMTAYAYEHDQQRCSQLGMKAHVAKPVDMAVLSELLRSCSATTF